jgi:hypothetical protein
MPDPDLEQDTGSTPPPAANAGPKQLSRRGRRRRQKRLWTGFWSFTGILIVVISVSLYVFRLMKGPTAAPPKHLAGGPGSLEEQVPLVRGLPTDDEDAVRRKLVSKSAPSPTLTGIARHKASEMGRPAGPAYDENGKNLELASEELSPDSPLVREAAAALDVYRKSASWHDKLPLTYDTGAGEARMGAWYGKQGREDPQPGDMNRATLISAGDSKVVVLGFTCAQRQDAPLQAYFHRAPGGKLLLDWEAWTGWGEMTIEDFKKSRSLIPVLLRVVISESSYYNYEFADTTRYLAVKIRGPDGLGTVTGYVLRKSILGTAVANLIGVHLPNLLPKDTPLPPPRRAGTKSLVTLRAAFPRSAESDHCVMITELVADRWMLFPGEGR